MGNSGMGRKILVIFKFLIIIGLIAGLGVLTWLERTRRMEVEGQLESTRQAKMQIERNLKDLKVEKSGLEGELEDLKARARALAARLAEEKEAKESLSARITRLEQELAARKGEEELLGEIKKLKEEKANLEGLLEQIRLAKQALEEMVVTGGAEGVVKLPKVVVGPEAEGEAPRVLVVNRKFDFVVVSLGKNDGIRVGDTLTVHRKKKFIGKVMVEEVRENLSAATILPEWKKRRIKENDYVRLD